MRLSDEYIIHSKSSVQELKNHLSDSYETADMIKFEEFNSEYRSWPDFMKAELRSRQINNPNIKYIGRFFQGNFELKSPRFNYWTNVVVYVRYGKSNSKVHIKLKYFKLIFISTAIFSLISLLISIFDLLSGLPFLFIGLTLSYYWYLKTRKTIRYFKRYIG